MIENNNTSEIYHLLMYVIKLTGQRTHERLEQVGLYKGQPPLLFALWENDGLSRKELCDLNSSQPATITKMIKRLEKVGFVKNKPDPEDGRIVRVYLTKKGKDIKNEVEEIFELLKNEVFHDFCDDEIETFRHLLLKMRENLKS